MNVYTHLNEEQKKKLAPRKQNDFYETPPEVVEQFFTAAWNRIPDFADEYETVLDVGAGSGVWGRGAVGEWDAVDIDYSPITDCGYYYVGDFLTLKLPRYDLVVSNPPYYDYYHRLGGPYRTLSKRDFPEMAFNKMWDLSKRWIVMLTTSGFVFSEGRYERLWSVPSRQPNYVFMLPYRIPFIRGQQSGIPQDFVITMWDKLKMDGSTSLMWLGTKPEGGFWNGRN